MRVGARVYTVRTYHRVRSNDARRLATRSRDARVARRVNRADPRKPSAAVRRAIAIGATEIDIWVVWGVMYT